MLAEISPDTKHGFYLNGDWNVRFLDWDIVWREQAFKPDGTGFASVFRLPDAVQAYCEANDKHIKGWKQGEVGLIGLDIDREDQLDVAQADLIALLDYWDGIGVNPDSYRVFWSGSKGFAVHFMAEAFGDCSHISSRFRPQHEEIVLHILTRLTNGIIFDRGLASTLRLFRLPNTKHDKTDLYKIPLIPSEVHAMSIAQLKDLARLPRTDISSVPSSVADAALVDLIKKSSWRQAESTATTPTMHAPHTTPTTTPKTPEVQSSGNELLLSELKTLMRFDTKLLNAWSKVSIDGTTNSPSEFDYRFCWQLAVTHGWDEVKVRAAYFLFPGNCCSSMTEKRAKQYLDHTMSKIFGIAREIRAKSPKELIKADVSVDRDLSQTWIFNSNLWKNNVRLGKGIRDVYLKHIATAQLKADYLLEGKSKEYFLSVRQLGCSSGAACRAVKILTELGLLEQIAEGKGTKAATWTVRIPERSEEAFLIRKAENLKIVYPSKPWGKKQTSGNGKCLTCGQSLPSEDQYDVTQAITYTLGEYMALEDESSVVDSASHTIL